jgi:hypothetical protein
MCNGSFVDFDPAVNNNHNIVSDEAILSHTYDVSLTKVTMSLTTISLCFKLKRFFCSSMQKLMLET